MPALSINEAAERLANVVEKAKRGLTPATNRCPPNRDEDRTDLRDLISVGTVDGSWRFLPRAQSCNKWLPTWEYGTSPTCRAVRPTDPTPSRQSSLDTSRRHPSI
jgi:hypothetical protein